MAQLDPRPLRAVATSDEHPALAWSRSGAMALTGFAEREPLCCPVPLASCIDGAFSVLRALSPDALPDRIDAPRLLGERAAISGLQRAGRVSPGGACRILSAKEGALALNLARREDTDLLEAWLECETAPDLATLEGALSRHRVGALVERGRELGLALAAVRTDHREPAQIARVHRQGAQRSSRRRGRPRVLDFSSLWAGPLCTHLLQLGGAEVIKVESLSRPDGARRGPPAFFDLMHAGKRSVALDFDSPQGRAQLRALVDDADIVIEASRPRALRQLGIDADALVQARGDLTWIALSGHGRGEPQENWIAYGDDAGVDAGLAHILSACVGEPCFVGDAIADPLSGVHAATLAWWSWHAGGSRLISVALSELVRAMVEWSAPADGRWHARYCEHRRVLDEARIVPAAPQARAASGLAADLGADTRSVLAELGMAC